MDCGFEPVDPSTLEGAAEETTRQDEKIEGALSCVEAMPAKYREVLMLRYSGDLSYSEIARFLGISVSTVTMRLTYARRFMLKKAKKKGLL